MIEHPMPALQLGALRPYWRKLLVCRFDPVASLLSPLAPYRGDV